MTPTPSSAAPRRPPSHHAAPNALCGGFIPLVKLLSISPLSPIPPIPPSLPPSTLALSSHPTPPSLLLRLIVSITRVCLREHPALFRPHEEQNNAHNLLGGVEDGGGGGRGVCGAHVSLGDTRGGNRRRPRGMNHVATRRDCRDFRDQRAERCLSHLSSVGCRSDSKKRRLFPSVGGAHKKEGVTAKSKGGEIKRREIRKVCARPSNATWQFGRLGGGGVGGWRGCKRLENVI